VAAAGLAAAGAVALLRPRLEPPLVTSLVAPFVATVATALVVLFALPLVAAVRAVVLVGFGTTVVTTLAPSLAVAATWWIDAGFGRVHLRRCRRHVVWHGVQRHEVVERRLRRCDLDRP